MAGRAFKSKVANLGKGACAVFTGISCSFLRFATIRMAARSMAPRPASVGHRILLEMPSAPRLRIFTPMSAPPPTARHMGIRESLRACVEINRQMADRAAKFTDQWQRILYATPHLVTNVAYPLAEAA
jgi:hypothetical protein